MAGSVVLGRAGSSPNRSMLAAGGGGGLLTACGGGGARLAVPFLSEADLSILAFSCTTLRGCGSEQSAWFF